MLLSGNKESEAGTAGENLFLHTLAGQVWMSSQDCRYVSSFASPKGAEIQFLALASFPSFPFWLQFYPVHVNSLLSICTSRFPVYWEHQRPQLSRSGRYGEIQICTWSFLKCITEICFSSFSKWLWRYLQFTFFFSAWSENSFCTCVQEPGSCGKPLDGAPGRFTEHTARASLGAGE